MNRNPSLYNFLLFCFSVGITLLMALVMPDLPYLHKRFRKGRRPFYEVLCKCNAYAYPHRFGSGACNGLSLVEYVWNKGLCGDCRFRDFDGWSGHPECQVLSGREDLIECEQLQEFLRANEAYSKRMPRR